VELEIERLALEEQREGRFEGPKGKDADEGSQQQSRDGLHGEGVGPGAPVEQVVMDVVFAAVERFG